jgi:zinc transport system substrate-binding protein
MNRFAHIFPTKFHVLLLLPVMTLLCACHSKPTASQLQVVVSIEPYHYFVDEISGGKAKVITLVPKGSSPETYEPTAQQMIEVARSQVYFKVGAIGFEHTWMPRFMQANEQLQVVDCSKGIHPVKSVNGIEDPHVWMSARNARVIATHIYRTLCKLSPKDKPYFTRRYQLFVQKAERLDSSITRSLANKPRQAFVIYHPALTYFAHEYHLTQLPIEEEGREPSARQLTDLIETARQLHAHVLFVQREFANRNTQTIADALRLEPQYINPLDYNWLEQMNLITQILSR